MKLFQTFVEDEATDEINYNDDDHNDDDEDEYIEVHLRKM